MCKKTSWMKIIGKKWLCDDCQNGSYECSVCHNYGTLYDRNTGKKYNNKIHVIKCEREDCGRFYHKKCLQKYKANFMERHNISAGDTTSKDAATRGKEAKRETIVPLHSQIWMSSSHVCYLWEKRNASVCALGWFRSTTVYLYPLSN